MNKRTSNLADKLFLAVLVLFPAAMSAQTLSITNGIQIYSALTNTTVTMTGRCELRVTGTNNPISGCLINLNSADAWLFLPNLKPSVVVSTYLGQILVSGASAVADSNVRVVQYGAGAVVIPQPPTFQPLQVFNGPHFTGASARYSQYTYYTGTGLGVMNTNISSFKLKRGYMAVLAQNTSGSGFSKCYVAQDGDLEVSLLPASLDNNVSFIYVTPWRWVNKKGIAGDPGISLLNVSSWYNWNINQSSSRDLEYVAIEQQPYWPGLGQNWQALGVNTLLGYNEPDNPVEDAYKNLTPPGSVSDAVARWPGLLATGLRIGSPATTDGGRYSWLYPFISQADAAGLRVDFVAAHYYQAHDPADPAGCASQMYSFLLDIWNNTHRPIWVTEWNNGANWTDNNPWPVPTYAQQQAAVSAMMDMLESAPFVERYQLYNWVEDGRAVVTNGVLTSAGVTYRDKVSALSYVQALPDNGTRCLAQYLFETNMLDSSGYGNNGLAVGAPAFAAGHSGQALVLDGTNNYVQLPPNLGEATNFTFAAWVNWNGGLPWQRIFDFGNDTSHYLFLTPSSGGGTLRFAINNGGGEQLIETTGMTAGQWRHVAVTLSGGNAKLYTNGVLAASSTSFTITPSSFNPILNYLGKSQFSADPLFSGKLDDVQIADYAMTAAQIASLQTNLPPQFTTNQFARSAAVQGAAYSDTLAGAATDPNSGNTLTYSKVVGPAWLNVSANGTLTGTPGVSDVGMNYFAVRVTDQAGASSFAVLTIITLLNPVWNVDASGNWSDTNKWLAGLVANGAGLTADFSTINITAGRTVTLDTSRSLGGLKFGDAAGAQNWNLTASGGSVLTLATGTSAQPSIVVTNTATIAVPLAGMNGFVKSGPGTLVLGADNPLSGTLNLDRGIDGNNNDGATRITHPNAVDNVTALNIRNTSVSTAGGATLQLDGSAGGIVIAQPVSVTCRNNSTTPTIQNLAGTNTLTGFIALNVGGNMFNLQSDAGLLVFTGTNQYVGGLTGGRSYAFSGAGDHLVSGPILNSTNGAPIGLTKSGAGTLTLAAANTYTNTTTVSGGTLLVNGSIGASPVIVAGTATLGGNGTINGAVTVQSGGTLAPGISIGKLTVNNSVTLQAGSTTRMKISKVSQTNDQLRVTGGLTYAGALVVTNLAGALVPGDSFTLFQAAAYGGAFTSFSLPPLNTGLAWQTSGLTNGIISVIATNLPTIGTYAFQGGGAFQVSGTGSAGQIYQLLAVTNLSPPISWIFVTSTTADTNGEFQMVDLQATNLPQRFYWVTPP